VSWWTIMNLTLERGRPILDDPARLGEDVQAVGVDETSFLHATAQHPTWFATGITDLTPGRPARLLDIAQGRSGTVLSDWLAARAADWRARIVTASLDPFRGMPPPWPPSCPTLPACSTPSTSSNSASSA
jgi:hypothetical protein